MLDVLFSKKLETKEKKDLPEEQCGIPMKEERIKEEVETMCSLGQGIYEEGFEQGIDRGEKLRAVKAAKKLLKLGKITIKEIANCTDLTVDEVRKLEEEMCATA